MKRRRFLAFLPAMVLFVPTAGHAADPAPEEKDDGKQAQEQAEIDRTRQRGTGLFWGGVGVGAAGGLTLIGLVPTNRNFLLAEGRLERCRLHMESDPINVDCQSAEDELERRRRVRTTVAVVGSVVLAGGVVLLGTGIWMRRKARRQQQEHDRKFKPEWALLPDFCSGGAGLRLQLRF